jgi:hypothetical protein
MPESRDQIRGLLIRVLEGPHPVGIPNLRKRRLFLADNYLNAHSSDKALHVAAEFDSSGTAADGLGPIMHQVRALAALDSGLEYEGAAAALESDLSGSRGSEQRAMAAGLLAELYLRLGRRQDALKLLERELGNPSVVADSAGHADLAARYAKLEGGAGTEGVLGVVQPGAPGTAATEALPTNSTAVDDWIQSLKLGWYNYTDPESLDDPRLKDLDGALRDPGSILPAPGQIKLLLLAARGARVSNDQRQLMLANAAIRLVLLQPSYSRMEAIASSAIGHPAFGDESRLRVLWTVLALLAEDGRKADYGAWRQNPLCEHFSPDLRRQIDLLDQEAELDRNSPAAISQLAAKLSKTELSGPALQTLRDLFGFLLELGALTDAENLAAGAQGWKLAADAERHRGPLQIEFSRRLRQARGINPMHEAMASSFLKGFPDIPKELPQEFRDVRLSGPLPERQAEATLNACLYIASTRRYSRVDLSLWGTVFASLPMGAQGTGAVSAMLRSGLAAAPDDDVRADLIVRFISSADIDDPKVREAAEHEFSKYRLQAQYPRSFLVIRLYEIHRDLRLGVPVELATVYGELKDPRVAVVRERDCLKYFTQIEDKESLKRTVDAIDPGTLLSPGFVAQALPAFTLLGMETERRSARSAALNALEEYISDSWASGSSLAADAALDIALALGDPSALPQKWVHEMAEQTPDPVLKLRLPMVNAFLRADWRAVESTSAALNLEFPERFAYYWYHGIALHYLGRDAEAAAALDTFTQHARDDVNYSSAIGLLHALKTG